MTTRDAPQEAGGDPLDELEARLDAVADRAIEDQAAWFETACTALNSQLKVLDEV